MFQNFCHGLNIHRHDLKGIYVSIINKTKKQPADPQEEVFCTLHEGCKEDCEIENNVTDPDGKPGPICITYQGVCATLRPWDPYTCIIAASIHNRLIHFPIRPGNCIFALGFSLETLSHIADIVRTKGRVIGVIDKHSAQNPTPEELRKFLRRHPGASIIIDEIQVASFEHYERLLSLPKASKYAFLSALHPRLGAKSPAQKLNEAPEPSTLAKQIFDFLVCNDAANVQCLVVRRGSPNAQIEVIRETVLSHIDMLHQWRATMETTKKEKDETFVPLENDETEKADTASDGQSKKKKKKSKDDQADTASDGPSKKKKSKDDQVHFWVLVDFRTDCMVKDMSRLPNGLRTGLFAKEQLCLAPYFTDHALLLMKYDERHDERHRQAPKHKRPSTPVAEENSKKNSANAAEGGTATSQTSNYHPPAMGQMPVPSFALRSENKPKIPAPVLAIEAAPKFPTQVPTAHEEQKTWNADETTSGSNVDAIGIGTSAGFAPETAPGIVGSCPAPPGLAPPPGMQHGLRVVAPQQKAAAQGGILRAPRWRGPADLTAPTGVPLNAQNNFQPVQWPQTSFGPGVRNVGIGGNSNAWGHNQAAFSVEHGVGTHELLLGTPGEEGDMERIRSSTNGISCDQLWPSRPSQPPPGLRYDEEPVGAGPRRPPPVYAPYGKGGANNFNGENFGGMPGAWWPQARNPPDQLQPYLGPPDQLQPYVGPPSMQQLDQFQFLRMSF